LCNSVSPVPSSSPSRSQGGIISGGDLRGKGNAGMRADGNTDTATFEDQYAALVKSVFREIVADAIAEGKQPDEQARVYAELGKPDFALAYLLAGELPDAEKRALYA